jgi:hypothetical protein
MYNEEDITVNLDNIRGNYSYEPGQKVLVKQQNGKTIPGQIKSLASYTVSDNHLKKLRDSNGKLVRENGKLIHDELNPYDIIQPSQVDYIKKRYENWGVAYRLSYGPSGRAEREHNGILISANYIVDIGDKEITVSHKYLEPLDDHSSRGRKLSGRKLSGRKLSGRKLSGRKLSGRKLGGRKLGKTIKKRKL